MILGIEQLLSKQPTGENVKAHRVFNIGNNSPKKLMTFIRSLETELRSKLDNDVEFERIFEPIKSDDVPVT